MRHAPGLPFASAYLDAVRAVAACVVLLGHIHNLFFVADPVSSGIFARVFYALAARGHDAVMVFFVLSGLLIAASAARAKSGAEGWRHYAIARAARLYAVLVPALMLTLFWDGLGVHFFGAGYGVDDIVVNTRMTVQHWFASLFFLQEVWLPPFGSNQPLWSLAYEGWYYLMFPLGLLAITARGSVMKRVIYVAAFAACVAVVGAKISGYFLIWLMGAALFFLPAPPITNRVRGYGWLAATWLLIPAVILVVRKVWFAGAAVSWPADMVVAVAISLHLFVANRLALPVAQGFARAARAMANISFTLYLCHFPVLLFLSYLWVGDVRWEPDVQHLTVAAVLMIAVIGYSALIARVTEAKTPQLRAWLQRQFHSPKQGAYDVA